MAYINTHYIREASSGDKALKAFDFSYFFGEICNVPS